MSVTEKKILGKEMETKKNIQEKSVQKSVKSCNYPELSVKIAGVFI